MNELQLSKRLECVANYVKEGSKVADIGSDHAYLPSFLYHQGKITFAIAGEVNQGPYESAMNQVRKCRYEDVISVRRGDGLTVIENGEVDTITIAGMGGALIAQILESGKSKLSGMTRLILQPNVMADKVRIWLKNNDWELTAEEILEEDGKVYEVLVAEQGNPDAPYSESEAVELLLGPFLMKEKNAAFQKKWRSEIDSWKRIVAQFSEAKQTDEVKQKKQEFQTLIQDVEEVLST
ncbi:tRNA (adenine(22)-N(1))-methyltransferase [Alkalihalobacterium bogoriense]|uniref:tRNA (adenine(22)-N(1))-methyltransferase n=1 Tax=Alkalihalobacterium bogoriense TaxID=246272 RepID=UPI00047D0E10|nr:tRNA (adenine(22)-N(1))-methyltransferase TrmK [Alkalihalobacterium bogoriense]